MKLMSPVALLGFLLVAGAMPSRAAENGAAFGLAIAGEAPLICRATLDITAISAATGRIELGRLNERCNDPAGYQIFVEASEGLAGATLIVDGESISLPDREPILIAASDRPAIRSRAIAIDLAARLSDGSLSIRMVPR